jgi:hypothetical protein
MISKTGLVKIRRAPMCLAGQLLESERDEAEKERVARDRTHPFETNKRRFGSTSPPSSTILTPDY